MSAQAGEWWKRAVFYEIYIRSFQDSNGDGVGDLNGIASRLDYLEELGVDAIWITPFYPSPQVDFGYDISDHEDVHPLFGSLADFDRLVSAAHDRGIRVVIDIVLNHTSDRHPLFESSRSSRSSPHRDWFIWRDGAAPGQPPNNWESAFGGPAWTYDELTGQWYYHYFYKEQPDLNWRNPEVERRMLSTLAFWLDRGVDGFRLDAVNTLFEDPELRDNPPLSAPRVTLTGVYTQEFRYTRRLPEVHDVLKRVRTFVAKRAPEAVLISEAYVDTVADLVCFYGNDDEMHLPFNFFLAQVPRLEASGFVQAVEGVDDGCGDRWPSLVLNNHDIRRGCDRYGAGDAGDRCAKLLAAMLLTLRGTPFLYYGEEIGMGTEDPRQLDDVRDPVGRVFWPTYKGRDGSRRPMPWDGTPGGGFTGGEPWLPLAGDAAERNVRDQDAQPASVLNFYRALLRIRRTTPALVDGAYRTVRSHPNVLAYRRKKEGGEVLIALNMSGETVSTAFDEQLGSGWRVLLSSCRPADEGVDAARLSLEPWEAILLLGGSQSVP